MSEPKPGKPVLRYLGDAQVERANELALARVGQPEPLHGLNGTMRVEMSHAVTACGRCGGVFGGSGEKWRDGKLIARCVTKRCVCKRKRAPR